MNEKHEFCGEFWFSYEKINERKLFTYVYYFSFTGGPQYPKAFAYKHSEWKWFAVIIS